MTFMHECVVCGNRVEMDKAMGREVLLSGKGYVCISCMANRAWRVYTDGVRLVTNGSDDVLHTFASGIGLKRHWFKAGTHYLLMSSGKRWLALKAGAVRVTSEEIRTILVNSGKPGIRSVA